MGMAKLAVVDRSGILSGLPLAQQAQFRSSLAGKNGWVLAPAFQ